jgi:hypothetical protein
MPEKIPFVQEPDTFITAKPVEKKAGKRWVVKKVHTTIKIMDQDIPMKDPESGVVGFLPVLDDYEKALRFVDGDKSLLAGIEPVT